MYYSIRSISREILCMHGIIIQYQSHIDFNYAYFSYKQLLKDISTKIKFCLPRLANMTSSRQYFACKRQMRSFFSKSKCEKNLPNLPQMQRQQVSLIKYVERSTRNLS